MSMSKKQVRLEEADIAFPDGKERLKNSENRNRESSARGSKRSYGNGASLSRLNSSIYSFDEVEDPFSLFFPTICI